ncbi:Rrf2 family transcriptional regulator [Candidatus Saganbacteria bacterium]|nr:Rrf2 family transcriptional regulator [Candidatus Saganbacteria bacterium]
MRISSQCDYAVRAGFVLALNFGKEAVSIQAIADEQDIPKRFLEHLLLSLKNAGLVKSNRGKDGGYMLAKDPGKISIEDIFKAIEGTTSVAPQNKAGSKSVLVSEVWAKVQENVIEVLQSVSLQDLVDKSHKLRKSVMYHI